MVIHVPDGTLSLSHVLSNSSLAYTSVFRVGSTHLNSFSELEKLEITKSRDSL